jgi:Domain of unknown function (DUF4440)/Domain of unknown function (DUF3471)
VALHTLTVEIELFMKPPNWTKTPDRLAKGTEMKQLATIIIQGLCVLTLIIASNLSLIAVQQRTVQMKSTQKVSSDEIVEQLKRAAQELLDAVGRGDKAVWERYMADGSIYADEEGRVLTRDELIKELRPLPPGYQGSIKVGETKSLVQGNVAVLSHVDHEELVLYGQKLLTNYLPTQTWARQKDGGWRVVSTQVMALPNERKPAFIDPKNLDSYVGQYELALGITYSITREGDKLFGQRTGRTKEELLPLCVDIFYRKGAWRGEKVFQRDGQGRVITLLDRRENNDLVWKRIK